MKQYRICDFEGLSVWVSDDYDFHFNVFISNIGCIVLVESDDFFFYYPCYPSYLLGFPCGSAGKESAHKAGDLGSIPGTGRWDRLPTLIFMGFPGGSDGRESTRDVGDPRSIPGSGGSPGEGKGYPRQYSGLENSMGSQRVGHD